MAASCGWWSRHRPSQTDDMTPCGAPAVVQRSAGARSAAVVRSAAVTAEPQRAQTGQGLVEYGLILGLAALVTIVALLFFGGALAAALSILGQAIDSSS